MCLYGFVLSLSMSSRLRLRRNVESSSRFVEPHLRLLFRDGGELGLEKTTAEHWTHRCFCQLGWCIDMNSIRGNSAELSYSSIIVTCRSLYVFLAQKSGLFFLVKLADDNDTWLVYSCFCLKTRNMPIHYPLHQFCENLRKMYWFIMIHPHTWAISFPDFPWCCFVFFLRGKVRYLNVWLVQIWEPFLRI